MRFLKTLFLEKLFRRDANAPAQAPGEAVYLPGYIFPPALLAGMLSDAGGRCGVV